MIILKCLNITTFYAKTYFISYKILQIWKRLRCLFVFNDNKITFIYDIAKRRAYISKKSNAGKGEIPVVMIILPIIQYRRHN